MSAFSDPAAVARYAEGPVRLVPGFVDLQRMAAILLAEHANGAARILVLGAGGGLELKVFATRQPDWTFLGVDPSAAMLGLAVQTLGADDARVELIEGLIERAPEGPFDGATCLLTLHLLQREERLRTLVELRARLKPGAPLIVAHHSFPQDAGEKAVWLARFAAFGVSSGLPTENMQNAVRGIGTQLPVLSPEDDEALLREAGFANVGLFYAAFSFRGWVAYRA